MNLQDIFGTQLPLGNTIFLAVLTAAFLHFVFGMPIEVHDIPADEFILRASFLFGYYTTLSLIARLIATILLALVHQIALIIFKLDGPPGLPPHPNPAFALSQNPSWIRFRRWLLGVLVNLADVVAMFTAFIWFSEQRLAQLAPIGLFLALVLYVFGRFDQPTGDQAVAQS